jgi:hypothetical protein
MLRFAQQGALATAGDTGAGEINVDPAKIFLFGHSQGATHGSIALPFSDFPGAVLSGNGGGLVEALMNKTNPVNIASAHTNPRAAAAFAAPPNINHRTATTNSSHKPCSCASMRPQDKYVPAQKRAPQRPFPLTSPSPPDYSITPIQ